MINLLHRIFCCVMISKISLRYFFAEAKNKGKTAGTGKEVEKLYKKRIANAVRRNAGKLTAVCFALCIAGAMQGNPDTVYAQGSGVARIHFLAFNKDTEGVLLESRDANGNPVFGMVDSGEDWDYPDGSDPRYPLRSGVITDDGNDEEVVSYLRKLGVNQDNFLFYIGTHPHSDHIGTADTVIREFQPQTLYLMPYDDSYIDTSQSDVHLWDNQYVYDQTLAAAEETGINIVQDINDQNSRLTLGNFQIQIVNYDPSYQDQKTYDANWFCLGVIAEANGNTAFLTSDMCDDDGDLTRVMQTYPQVTDLEVLEANHHGLFDSMTDTLVETASPDVLILPGAFSNIKTSRLNLIGSMNARLFALPAYTSEEAIVVELGGDTVTTSVDGSFRIYTDNDGKTRAYSNGLWCEGLFEQDGVRYYAKDNGILAVNEDIYDESTGLTYHADKDGHLTLIGGWVTQNGQKYYIGDDGTYKKGWLEVSGNRYYMDPDTGAMQTGWVEDGGKWYLLDGTDGRMLKGWQQVGVDWYYMDPDTGVMQSDCWIRDTDSGAMYWLRGWGGRAYHLTMNLDGYTVSFGSDGKVSGSTWIRYNGTWSYISQGQLSTGWVKVGIDWYYFDENGTMKSNELCSLDGNLYYFRDWGGMLYDSWYQNPSDGNWYYLRGWGAALNAGWSYIDDNWYYFDPDCTMKKDELCQIGNDLYYFRSWGAMLYNGWHQNPADGNWYYFRDWGGALNTGWSYIDRDWYYFNSDCTMKREELCWLDGNLYYFRGWGGRMYNGWYQDPETGAWYLFDANGRAYRNQQARNGRDTYYFNDDGTMYTGWREENGKTYYYRDWGGMAYSLTMTIDGVSYTFNYKGELV